MDLVRSVFFFLLRSSVSFNNVSVIQSSLVLVDLRKEGVHDYARFSTFIHID